MSELICREIYRTVVTNYSPPAVTGCPNVLSAARAWLWCSSRATAGGVGVVREAGVLSDRAPHCVGTRRSKRQYAQKDPYQ